MDLNVWSNLLSNAVKFTERGGSIAIKQTSDESHVRVSVSDTGLGLVLVKRVLELMEGGIQITSEEGRGSTFTVTLSLAGSEY